MEGNVIGARLRCCGCSETYRKLRDLTTPHELEETQEASLKALHLHARAKMPYYQRVLKEIRPIHGGAVDMSKNSVEE